VSRSYTKVGLRLTNFALTFSKSKEKHHQVEKSNSSFSLLGISTANMKGNPQKKAKIQKLSQTLPLIIYKSCEL
jgi:hypothetical protein